jgi:hypothetical protein
LSCASVAEALLEAAVWFAIAGRARRVTEQWGYDKLRAVLETSLSAVEIVALAEDGATWTEDRAVEEALRQ